MDLVQKHCVPCEGGVPRLSPAESLALMPQIPLWALSDDSRKVSRRFLFDDFKAAMLFVNAVAALAEAEAHHPDLAIRYSVVDVTIYTHAISGLSENDFILAAKIDRL